MSEIVLTNARLVLEDEVVSGSVRIADGLIADVDTGVSQASGAVDLEGDLLLPGLIELHTDNVEKTMVPRPGVVWPSPLAAILAHDVQIAGAGITTVFDAISVGEYSDRAYRRQLLAIVVDAVSQARDARLFRAEHFLHLRCEISDDAVVELFDPHADAPAVRLISVMDHTPGQRQWRDLDKYRTFRNRDESDAQFETEVRLRMEKSHDRGAANRRRVLERWRPRGLPVASHDDTTIGHVGEATADGIAISEFPTTMEAARAARQAGMTIVMGAPNLVRGGSHSGNVSATELAEAGLLDAMSSDYAPFSLLEAAFRLHDGIGLPLPDAVATVTSNPARVLGLHDRGRIAPGLHADLVHVRRHADDALVREVWREGTRIV